MGLVRRIVTFALVVAVSFVGIPLPAYAASEESPPLTFNGRPLSELLHGRATGAPFPLPALLQQADGQISGVVVDEDGRPLVEHAVQLTRVFSIGGNRAEQISGTGTTNVEGGFSFSGLQPSDYEIKVLVADAVIASAAVTLVPGAMQVRGVAIAAPPLEGGGLSTWNKVAIGTGVGLGSFLFVVLRTLSPDPRRPRRLRNCGGSTNFLLPADRGRERHGEVRRQRRVGFPYNQPALPRRGSRGYPCSVREVPPTSYN